MTQKTNNSWKNAELESLSSSWILHLTAPDLIEIEGAIDHFLKSGLSFEKISKETFSIPVLGVKLTRMFEQVNSGLGICSIKGLPVAIYTEREYTAAYLGIATYFGNLRPQPQGSNGWLTNHIRDFGTNIKNKTKKIILSQTNVELSTHTDSCDISSLLCLNNSKHGGENFVASSVAIREFMKESFPEHYKALTETLPYDRNVLVQDGDDPWFMMPVFNTQGETAIFFNMQYAMFAQNKFASAPRMSAVQFEALQHFQALSVHPDYAHPTKFMTGDIQFVNNLVCVHSRTGYVDGDSPDQIRHLIRLWLSPKESRPIPEYYASRWGSTVPGDRGGINSQGAGDGEFKVAMMEDVLKRRAES